jgi:XTP/dITP diphosphohydrolase
MDIYLATSSDNKLRELAVIANRIFKAMRILSPKSVGGMPDVEEGEASFEENAGLKARALKAKLPKEAWVLADDSGLEVYCLKGRPGALSARYAGPGASFEENNAKLLTDLEGMVKNRRAARFVCCLVLIGPSGKEHVFKGGCEGAISIEPRGQGGFGYDPVFIPEPYDRTFAELGTDIKNKISHRADAVKDMIYWLRFVQPAFGAGV